MGCVRDDKEEEKKTVEELIVHANSTHAIISNRSGICVYSLIMGEA